MRYAAPLALALFAAAAPADVPHVEKDDAGRITHLPAAGVGLNGVAYWETALHFSDAMKAAGISRNAQAGGPWRLLDPDGPAVEFDRDGYPADGLPEGQGLSTNVFVHAGGKYPAGTYVLTWDGTGEMEVLGDAKVKSAEGRLEAEVPEGGASNRGLEVRLLSSDSDDPVRNVRLWMPGQEDAESTLHPATTGDDSPLRPFGVLRMMDWHHTNKNPVQSWDDRTLPTSLSYSGDAGVPYEVMVELANALKKDLWITVPHQVVDGDPETRDEYVTKLANLLRHGADADGEPYDGPTDDPAHPPLDGELNVWLEYSNETWNATFGTWKNDADPDAGQFTYVGNLAEELGLKRPEAHGRLSHDLFLTFEEAFGTDRLVKVVAGQAANPWVLKTALATLPPVGEPGSADAASVTNYFTPTEASQLVNAHLHEHDGEFGDAGMAELAALLEEHLEGEWYDKKVAAATDAAAYGVPLVSYEGNQHLTPKQAASKRKGNEYTEPHEKLVETLHYVTRHERMGELYRKSLDLWAEAGGKTPVAFVAVGSWGRHGQWGHMEYQDQPIEEATMYRALTEWAEQHAGGFDVESTSAGT